MLARARWLFILVVGVTALAVSPAAFGHSERLTDFPDPNAGNFPEYRTEGPSIVVCRQDSRRRIMEEEDVAIRARNLALLDRCRYRNIQAAINNSQSDYRILVLPGVYMETHHRTNTAPPGCEDAYARTAAGNTVTYEQQKSCPHAQNLIAILGDDPNDPDRICDQRCNLQIEGMGITPSEVKIRGDRFSGPEMKLNGIRLDRADGAYLRNFQVEFFDFNGVYALETNGFRIDKVITRYNREYGVLSFTSDHGIYENCEAYGNGDSGLYPGSGPNARHGMPDIHGHVYGIIIRNCDSHDNLMGTSGTGGNGTWYHQNRFHHNSAGSVVDSLLPGHPGMPQDFSKWTENVVYSNNKNLFSNGPVPPGTYTDDTQTGRDEYCKRPANQRDLMVVCPSFMMPVGSGLVLAGGNSNVVANNYYFDNWRLATMLIYVPSAIREETDESRQNDTSNNNRHEDNCLGVRPASLDPAQIDFLSCNGSQDPNGVDFWWDEEEGADCLELDQSSDPCVDVVDNLGNCWSGNDGFMGAAVETDPILVPDCPGLDVPRPPNAAKSGLLVPCVTWNPQTNTDPPGCETPAGQGWFDVPPEPQP